MKIEKTLSIIKPDAVQKQHFGAILNRIMQNKLSVVGIKMVQLTPEQAMGFYHEHKGKPFFNDLVRFMSSGPIVVAVLAGEEAIDRYRQLMGTTDPKLAKVGTLRHDFATNITQNAVHGSDSAPSAAREIEFFFPANEIYLASTAK